MRELSKQETILVTMATTGKCMHTRYCPKCNLKNYCLTLSYTIYKSHNEESPRDKAKEAARILIRDKFTAEELLEILI